MKEESPCGCIIEYLYKIFGLKGELYGVKLNGLTVALPVVFCLPPVKNFNALKYFDIIFFHF